MCRPASQPLQFCRDEVKRETPSSVLFVSPPVDDYFSVTLLHGLRHLLGDRLVDYPRYGYAYSRDRDNASRIHGRGFSVYFLLPESGCDRSDIESRVRRGDFELIVFADIWRTWETFTRWRSWLTPRNTVLCDGADSPQVYPHAGKWWRKPMCWFLPQATDGFLYFKREWTSDSRFNLWHRMVPRAWRSRLPHYQGLRQTAFSFPAGKIAKSVPTKNTLFARHIVDPEVAARVLRSSTGYAFATEAEYYADLQSAHFGITIRRSGWDCMRHYEIAANGAVPCFRRLHDKQKTCAPHGLVPGENCLAYDSVDDLLHQIESLDVALRRHLAEGALRWVRSNTTELRARELLVEWQMQTV